MSSAMPPGLSGHLENRDGDEIVFCHNPDCRHEWYRSQHESLQCPQCGGDITEIIDPENDPRHDFPLPSFLGLGSSRPPFPGHDHSDSDPEEEDIERHFGRHGFFTRTNAHGSSLRQGRDGLADPSDADAVLRRFHDMLVNDFRVGPGSRQDGEDMFPAGASRIRTTTFRGPFGGSTTFTIATGPMPRPGASSAQFNTVFGDLMGSIDPPGARRADGRASGSAGTRDPSANLPPVPGGPAMGIAASLTEILQALWNPAAAVHGDTVYSQEALDRIITSLMEANPQSNAAPPASQSALDSLQKKMVDDEMLGPEGKAECTICIDDIKKNDEVLMLPCKHWFHGECVTLWLKEHNTCPICRTPIESSNGSGNAAGEQSSSQASASASAMPSSPNASGTNPLDRSMRNSRDSEARLNAIRNLAGLRTPSDRSDRVPSFNRRNSLSPQAPRIYSTSELASRVRVRSPSLSRDLDGEGPSGNGRSHADSVGSSGAQGESGRNPLSWLRNTFGRSRNNQDGGDQRQP